MDRRLELQALLEEILGTRNVYFQPPANVHMKYPSIVYTKTNARTRFADNAPYKRVRQYQVTYIDQNPESDVTDKIAELPMCIFERHFAVNDLHHDVFRIFF
jgi:hypothetical protein